MNDNDGLITFLIAFIMTAIVVFVGINHAKTLDKIEKGEVVTIAKKVYMCKEITK